jgi:hypothetical protein
MQNVIPEVAIGLIVLGAVYGLIAFRTHCMRELASRWGLRYLGRQLPETFVMDRRRFLYHWIVDPKMVSRVIAGELNGSDVVIFDSSAPGRGNTRCTVLAVQTERNPFAAEEAPWKVTSSKGWFALWRTGWLQIPWTMSIAQIEEHLNQI